MRRTALVLLVLGAAVTLGILSIAGPTGGAPPAGDVELQVSSLTPDEFGECSLFPFPLPPTTCGGNICGKGQYCCNPSCGTCVNFGDYCTHEVCNPTE